MIGCDLETPVPPEVGFWAGFWRSSWTCWKVTSSVARTGVPSELNRVNFWVMLVMTASNDQAGPHWKRTFGGRPLLV